MNVRIPHSHFEEDRGLGLICWPQRDGEIEIEAYEEEPRRLRIKSTGSEGDLWWIEEPADQARRGPFRSQGDAIDALITWQTKRRRS